MPLTHLEGDDLHAKDWSVKLDGVGHTFHSQNQMVQMAHFHWTWAFEFDMSNLLVGHSLEDTVTWNTERRKPNPCIHKYWHQLSLLMSMLLNGINSAAQWSKSKPSNTLRFIHCLESLCRETGG